MRLYSYFRSTSAWRVRIGLAWKGIPYEYVALNLLEGQQALPDHRARSPLGKIPVLELGDGRVLTESMAILHYLDETHPEPPFLPTDPYLRARARMIAEMVNSGIQPFQNLIVLKHVKRSGVDEQEWARHWVGTGIAALERAVQPTAGRFCVGDTPSLADIYLVPQLAHGRRLGLDLAGVPTLLRIDALASDLPAFRAAAPEAQPDAPPSA
jgi:maleylacetoacetate isomerase